MKFIKVYQQNQKDFFLVNLANITHVAANANSGTCLIHLTNGAKITCFPTQTHSLLTQISEYNRQLIEFLTRIEYLEDEL